MKVSRYIPKLAYQNVKKKKNRTWLSFVSVTLSSCTIFVCLTLFFMVFSLSHSFDDEKLGTWHYQIQTSSDMDLDPYRYHYSYVSKPNEKGVSNYKQDEEAAFFILLEGREPRTATEILAPQQFGYQVGQVVEDRKITGIYQPCFSYEPSFLTDDSSLMNDDGYYFISDSRIQDGQSLASLAELAGIEQSDIIQNEKRITHDITDNYLQDTTMILAMFIFIVILTVLMCLVSIYNVLIVNDDERRQEIGLLKSIGITVKELKWMLFLEMGMIGLCGGFFGACLGGLLSSTILLTILSHFKIAFSISYVLRWSVIALAVLGSALLMIGCGFKLYAQYFTTSPIADLKGTPIQYDIPYNADRFSFNSSTWQMFVIYNERIKKQTRNLRRSFLLVMLTITVFCGIWISNMLYQRNYLNVDTDIGIVKTNMLLNNRDTYFSLDEEIYRLGDEKDTFAKKAVIDRTILGLKYYMPLDSFSDAYLANLENDLSYQMMDDVLWSQEAHYGMVLDQKQLEELSPYIVYGRFEDLDEQSVVLICNQYGYYTSSDPMRQFDQSYPVRCMAIDQSSMKDDQIFYADMIINLPYEKNNLKYSQVADHCYTIAFTPESIETLSDITLDYVVDLKLQDSAVHNSLYQSLVALLEENHLTDDLTMTDYVQVREDGQFAIFVIEVLLYPLFFLLVIIGCVNINNVLKGNIYLKRNDFSTLKSVGMTDKQLRMIMVYEYAESYINAGAIAFVLSLPIYGIEHFFNVASTFRIGDNFAGMYVISFAVLSPLIIISLAARSFRHLKDISALDGLKDIT